MFKKIISCIVLASFLSLNTGCFGSFTLTQKLYNFNNSFDNKFVKTIVFWAFVIVPVYGTATFIDAVVLNLIEFWLGSNPLALNSDTETQKTFTANGKTYNVTIGKGSITILQTKGPDAGKKITLNYRNDEKSWYLLDGISSTKIASFEAGSNNKVNLYYPDGRTISHNIEAMEIAAAVK